MNELLVSLGVDAWRPVLAGLLLPPAPFVLLALIGGALMRRRRRLAWCLLLTSCLGLWFMCTVVAAQQLREWLLPPARALAAEEITPLKRAPRTAIVVLGGGRIDLALEYGVADLQPRSLQRLRYAIWLARQTDLPVLFSGGISHGGKSGSSEAEIGARIAERELGRALRWQESESRDTRENAQRSVAMLQREGIQQIVLVTEGYHMPRAFENFERAIATRGAAMRVTAAPMGLTPWKRPGAIDFVPTRQGYTNSSLVLHEWFGHLIGA